MTTLMRQELEPAASGGVFLPYQQRWTRKRLRKESRVRVMEKSRRIGVTWATAAECVLGAALMQGQGGQDHWYVSYNEESAKEFIRDCEKWARWLGIAASEIGVVILREKEDGELEGVRAFQITFPSKFRITALTSSARNIRGKQGRVIIDEAAFHDDLKAVLKAALALNMWGGEVWVMSSHNGADNPFAKLVDDIRDGRLPYVLHRVTIDDALAEGLYKRIAEVLGEEAWSPDNERRWLATLELEYSDGVREELYCEPSRGGASYIGRPLVEAVMIEAPVLRLTRDDSWLLKPQEERTAEVLEWLEAVVKPLLEALPEDQPHAFGWDFGRYSDRSVLAPFTLTQALVERCPFLIECENIPHNDQWTVMEYVGRRLPGFFKACLDAGGNGSWIAEQALITWGDSIVDAVQLSQSFYAENMPGFRKAHESGLIAYPRDLDVRNDMLLIRRVDGVPRVPKADKNESKAGGKKRHGDAALALFLGHCAASSAASELRRWEALTMPEQMPHHY